VIATRQLAKRQYTWLRSEPGCHWLWDDTPLLERSLDLIDSLLG
jgi:tRNA dimethylallyltransferase